MMITLPGGKKVHADSTGRQIEIGDKIKFRSHEYTLKDFGPDPEDWPGVSSLIFEEEVHTTEVPHECNVDKVMT